MKSDEGFLNNVGKQMLIQLMNGNVIRLQSRTLFVQELNKLETLRKKFLGVFYFDEIISSTVILFTF